jgi:cytochrome c peroxidase
LTNGSRKKRPPSRRPAALFHDGSAQTLADVVKFYDTRFQTRFTEQEKADLLAFLKGIQSRKRARPKSPQVDSYAAYRFSSRLKRSKFCRSVGA